MKIDALIIGGGMAGLWTLATLRARGYGAVLLDTGALGGMQTLTSQGIIHGDSHYRPTAAPDADNPATSLMPTRWQQALRGHGELNLRDARILAASQYLWTHSGKLGGYFLARRLGHLDKCPPEAYPPFLPGAFRGQCYRLHAAVLDMESVLQTIAKQYAPWILADCFWQENGRNINVLAAGAMYQFQPRRILYTAGRANSELTGHSQRHQPLHMAALRVPRNAPDIFGHYLDASGHPVITITTHRENTCKIYYLGGIPAEEGIHRSANAHIAHLRAILLQALPWLNPEWLGDDAFFPFATERISGHGDDDDAHEPVIIQRGRKLIAWPGKLTFAPLLAERLVALLPPANANPDFHSRQIPRVGTHPWTAQPDFLQ
ncbi:MAG: hypothetical protein Q4D61_05140 [Cardiobacteriaceae bacterium]|nr:hypothetical protein [Cardiobacteriaceae bacterium]